MNFHTEQIFLSTFMSLQNEAVDVDIDEILDMDTDDIRRSHLFVSIKMRQMTSGKARVAGVGKYKPWRAPLNFTAFMTFLIDDGFLKNYSCFHFSRQQSILSNSSCKRSEKDISVSCQTIGRFFFEGAVNLPDKLSEICHKKWPSLWIFLFPTLNSLKIVKTFPLYLTNFF